MSSPTPAVRVSYGLLGDVQVVVDGGEVVELGGAQPRTVLAALVAAGGQVVQASALVDAVWEDDPPASAAGTLQSYVSRLRKALGPAGDLLERRGPGYRLASPPEAFDWRRFEALADQGRGALEDDDPEGARALLLEADALWRGEVLPELADRPFVVGLAARLGARRLAARGDRIDADLRLGRHAAVLGELAELVHAHPLDEASWARLALARYRAGQQAEALRALADARRTLVDELGVEPSSALRDLELQVLRQDPALDLRTRATARVPAQRAPAAHRPAEPLVGRHLELAALVSALDDTTAAARLGVVEGEPGIGKTRLLEELGAVASDRGALVLWGRSHESGAAPAFWPWLPVLRGLRELAPEQVEPGLSALLDARGEDALASGSLFGVLADVAAALRRASRDRSIVVLLDDLQWADSASLQLLGFLAAHLTDEPVLVLATVRELDVGRSDELVSVLAAVARHPGSRRLRLGGLAPEATVELVRRTTGGGLGDDAARAIHDRAEGNPFYAGQLTRLLQDEGLRTGQDVGRTPVPAGVRDVVRQRLARLPAATAELLQVCAVTGRDVDLDLLPAATGRPASDCLDDLEPAVVQRLLTDVPDRPGTLRFVHALVREVVLEDVSSLRRPRLHLRVADALAGRGHEDDRELLAEHLWAAVPLGVGDRAAEALEQAAEVAIRRFALSSAGGLLERAVQLRRGAGTTDAHAAAELQALVRLTSVKRAVHGFGGVGDLLDRGELLASRLGRTDVEMELLWAKWAMADTACDFATAGPIALRFKDIADTSTDPRERAFGLHVWGIQCWHEGRIPDACAYLDAAADAAAEHHGRVLPAVTLDSPATLLSFEAERVLLAQAFRLHVHELMGDWPDVRAQLDELADGLDPFGRAMASVFACTASCAMDDPARVEERARVIVESVSEEVVSFWGGQGRVYLGWALLRRGEVEQGLDWFEQGRAMLVAGGLHTGMGLFLSATALALLELDLADAAEPYVRAAREELDAFGEQWPGPLVALAEAALAAARGEDPGPALAEARERAGRVGSPVIARRVDAVAARLRVPAG